MHTLTFNSEMIVINQLKHSRYSDLPKLWRANQSSFPIRVYSHSFSKYGTKLIYFTLHVDCLMLLKKINVEDKDILLIKDACNDFLKQAALTIDDFHIVRIDYCTNKRMANKQERDILFQTLHQCATQCNYLSGMSYDHGVYWHNRSRALQIYDKEVERKEKSESIRSYESDVIRVELQLKSRYIKDAANKLAKSLGRKTKNIGNPYRSLDFWVSVSREKEYLEALEKHIPHGDFYSLERANEIIDLSNNTKSMKKKLKTFLLIIQTNGLDIAAKEHRRNTINKYISILSTEMNICPFTIPESLSRSTGIDFIANPFYK